jgi:YidC/Oxa1 family membrane protein insertase
LFVRPEIGGQANALLTQHLFGTPLGTSLTTLISGGAAWPGILAFVVLLLVILAVAEVARRVARSEPPVPGASVGTLRMARILSWAPYLTVVFAAFVPLAATLYLAVTTTWTQVERAILRRRYLPGVTGTASAIA